MIELKKPTGHKTAVIAISDSPEFGGQIHLKLIYMPELKDDEELSDAQAFGGHAFGLIKDLLENMSKQEVDESQLLTVDNVMREVHAPKKQPKGFKAHSPSPNERFVPPKIVLGEESDLKALKEHKGKRH